MTIHLIMYLILYLELNFVLELNRNKTRIYKNI